MAWGMVVGVKFSGMRMALVLFSAMRNEGPFLFDWIAYHRAIGFDRIFIVTNDCSDGSYPLLRKMADAGVIEHIDQTVPEGVPPQKSAVQLTADMAVLEQGDWGIFLDADEYLNIKVGKGKVSDLVAYLDGRDVQGMLINWRLFGDSGQPRFQGSYISDDYLRCEPVSAYSQFKTFFKAGKTAVGFSPFLHRCVVAPGAGVLTDFVTGSGATLGQTGPGKAGRRHAKWLREGDEPFAHVMDDEIGYDIAQVNHYIVRDPVSFALKQQRGRGYRPRANFNGRHTDDFYQKNNKNDVTDDTILRWQGAVRKVKKDLLRQCGIAQELRDIEEIYSKSSNTPKDEHLAIEKPDSAIDFPLTFPEEVQGFVREVYTNAKAIIEYGSGGSTRLAAEVGVPCVAVESDLDWANRLNAALAEGYAGSSTSRAIHVDIGPTKAWGYPTDNQKYDQFWRYPMQVWNDPITNSVDTVLIDGRMRKACFAATLINIKRETRVLFDDYAGRRTYHEVEKFAKPTRYVGRMAEFIVQPGLVDAAGFAKIIPWFFQMK